MAHYVLYIYFGKERRVTSCLMLDETGKVVARGLAFCSFQDQPCRKRGRQIAYGRAIKAMTEETSDGSSFAFRKVCRPEVEQILEESGIDLWPKRKVLEGHMLYLRSVPETFEYKCEYAPVEITPREKEAVDAFLTAMKKKHAKVRLEQELQYLKPQQTLSSSSVMGAAR